MAIILQFRRPGEIREPAARPVAVALGEIIIFPGVRIEREVSDGKPQGAGAAPRRRAQRSRKK
jgi:hypothetical protein